MKRGDFVYSPPTKYRPDGEHHEIISAGPKWLTLKFGPRLHVDTLRSEQYGTQYYVSKEAYDVIASRRDRWKRIRDFLNENRWTVPEDLDLDAIEKVLGI